MEPAFSSTIASMTRATAETLQKPELQTQQRRLQIRSAPALKDWLYRCLWLAPQA
jgi:hypothetical protein